MAKHHYTYKKMFMIVLLHSALTNEEFRCKSL